MWGGEKGKKAYITVYVILQKKKREDGIFIYIYIYMYVCIYIYINCRIWVHLTEYMKTAYKIIKPLSPLSRDNYSLIILIVTINTILAAAQIYKFLRLESVTIPWLGTFEQSESCCFFYSHPWPSQSHWGSPGGYLQPKTSVPAWTLSPTRRAGWAGTRPPCTCHHRGSAPLGKTCCICSIQWATAMRFET